MPPDKIEQDVVVSLLYKMWLEDGTLFEETDPAEPLVYLHGYDNIILGLERELAGMAVGETRQVTVAPGDAYGEYESTNIDQVPLADFPPEITPEPGMLLALEDDLGNTYKARVTGVDDAVVTLDFNHPLAGKQLQFEVTITHLRAASPDECAHGHAHGEHGTH